MSGICGIRSSFSGEVKEGKGTFVLYGCLAGAVVLAIITGAMYASRMKWLPEGRAVNMITPIKNGCIVTSIASLVLFGIIVIKRCANKAEPIQRYSSFSSESSEEQLYQNPGSINPFANEEDEI